MFDVNKASEHPAQRYVPNSRFGEQRAGVRRLGSTFAKNSVTGGSEQGAPLGFGVGDGIFGCAECSKRRSRSRSRHASAQENGALHFGIAGMMWHAAPPFFSKYRW